MPIAFERRVNETSLGRDLLNRPRGDAKGGGTVTQFTQDQRHFLP